MTKVNFFLGFFAALAVALIPEFLGDLVSPWINPGDDVVMRNYIVIALGILFLLCLWWTTRQEKTESNPQRPRMLGWFEAISGVTLVFTTSIMLCGELGAKPSDQPPEVLWLVPAIIAVGSLAIEWPVERKKRYEDLSKWIWR